MNNDLKQSFQRKEWTAQMIFCNNFCKFYNSKSSNNFCEGQGSCGALFHFASCCASSEACAGAISAAARMVGKCPAKFLGQGRNQTWQSRWQGSRVHANTCLCRYCIHIYIYTLGAGGSPKVLWVGFCEWLKIVISLWRNVSFWRSHSLHRIVFCADEIFLIRVLIDQKSIIHTFIFVRNVWFVW